MTFLITATDTLGKSIVLPKPIAIEICAATDTPANSLSLTIPCLFPLNELTDISVSIDGTLVFSGIVDEQTSQYQKGYSVRIHARSYSALLIDNEAVPASYHTPSLADIFSRHAQPYGIKGFLGNNGVCHYDFTVKKGISEWEVIESFCKSVLKINPIVTNDGYLDVRADKQGMHYVFSNTRRGAIGFSNARLKRQRYGVVSQVTYKLSPNSDYIYSRTNDDAVARGIHRRRLLNLSSNASGFNEYTIQSAIQKSKIGSMEITLTLPDICICELYASAEFEDGLLGRFEDLCIRETVFSMSSSGVFTKIVLCPKEHLAVN
ncbi:MAG: hypothetical protein IKY44_03205 [Clostridia bacterium]|nr:hypothetical protein [Clostridia bacterium]